jgi:hypothetical protein
MEVSMFPELFLPIAYISVVGLLLLKDEYQSRRLNRERFEARAQVEWPVTVETISGPMYGHTDNISVTGALLVCLQPLYKGEIVKVVLNAPSRSMVVNAEVVWTDRYLPTEKYYPHNAIAVQFKRITDASRNFLTLAVYDYLKTDEN